MEPPAGHGQGDHADLAPGGEVEGDAEGDVTVARLAEAIESVSELQDLHLRLEFLTHVHEYTGNAITLADAKAGFVGTVAGILLTAALQQVVSHPVAMPAGVSADELGPWLHLIILAVALGSLLLTACYTFFAVKPKLAINEPTLVAFTDIAALTTDEYVRRFSASTDAQLVEQLARNAVELAQIALAKNRMVGRAFLPLVVATAAVVALYVSG